MSMPFDNEMKESIKHYLMDNLLIEHTTNSSTWGEYQTHTITLKVEDTIFSRVSFDIPTLA